MACLERKLSRKIHLIGCFLHFNELPLRHLIIQMDGKTVSGNKFTGPICQHLGEDFYKEDTLNFEPIYSPLQRPPDAILKDLSVDQRLLLEYAIGISTGHIPDKFAKRRPGPVCLARWITTALRLLMLYARTAEPTKEMRMIVLYIQRVYVPVWFSVKKAKSFLEGPKILFEMIKSVKEIDSGNVISDIVFPVFQRNAFCCLGENILASMLFSDDLEIQEKAISQIISIRSKSSEAAMFNRDIPRLNFNAADWSQLADVSEAKYIPPCIGNLTNEEILNIKVSSISPPCFPLHSQSVERAVKMTSESASCGYSWQKRHNTIVSKIASRKIRSAFDTKKDYFKKPGI